MDAVTDDVFIDDIKFQGVDGYSLAATLFMPRGPRQQAILISSATAVPRKIYAAFATYLAGRGNVVVTYDYRGIGGSKPATLKGFTTSMSDWAAHDVTGAVTYMRARWPTMRLNYVGHSFGGQALGLLPNNNHVSRALFVAGQAAYWGLMTGNERYRVYALMNYIGKPITQIMGYAPGKLGIGEDLPKGVFLEWTKWVNYKRYMFDDPTLKTLANFTHYRGALRALSFTDDPWAPIAAVELLFGFHGDQTECGVDRAKGRRRRKNRSPWLLSPREPRSTLEGCRRLAAGELRSILRRHDDGKNYSAAASRT